MITRVAVFFDENFIRVGLPMIIETQSDLDVVRDYLINNPNHTAFFGQANDQSSLLIQ